MNYIKHLTGFFDLVVKDERLNPTHISLYISLFQYWNVNRFQNPISISRSETMRVSKISAKATYHKCMKELHQFGYIRYDPSYNPFRGSLVHLMNFESPPLNGATEQSEGWERSSLGGGRQPKKRTGSGQVLNSRQSGAEQAAVPSINNSNVTNGLNNREAGPNIKIKLMQRNDGKEEKEKLRQKKKNSPLSTNGEGLGVRLHQAEHYFKSKSYPASEARKFFNHYKALGWKLSGNPIEDWKALAEKWMINATSFSRGNKAISTAQLHTDKEKNYGEPL